MKAVSRVHITPHMHWDREWYFTTEESRILLVNNMEEILTRLEQDDEYKYYVLDGQTAVLEDYFAVVPENRARVKALVERGKLIIGPWYTQTDTTLVSGESIVRNLMYGIRDCMAFGEPMKIGYLPDSFGMSGQLPHIYNGFGITRTMFWRGCSERHGTDKTEFLWQSQDGSEVTAQVLPLGYAIGKYLPEDEAGLRKRLDSYLEVLESASVTKEILLPNGHDQMPLQQNIFAVMDKLREIYPQRQFVMSRFEEVFDHIDAHRDELATVKGEFIDGKYMRVHRTIGSTRWTSKSPMRVLRTKLSISSSHWRPLPGRWASITTTVCWRKCGKRSSKTTLTTASVAAAATKCIVRLSPASNWLKTWQTTWCVSICARLSTTCRKAMPISW